MYSYGACINNSCHASEDLLHNPDKMSPNVSDLACAPREEVIKALELIIK
jgi:hypothetical protein